MNSISRDGMRKDAADVFDKYDRATLQTIWQLEEEDNQLLDTALTFKSSSDAFLSHVVPSTIFGSYSDRFLYQTNSYPINYIFSSYNYLLSMQKHSPEQQIVFKLRANLLNNFFCCLVRPWKEEWLQEESRHKVHRFTSNRATAALVAKIKVTQV